MEEHAVERLDAKSPEEAIIERIGRDLNMAPFMARTQDAPDCRRTPRWDLDCRVGRFVLE